jgi:hypothetical protein
MTPKIQLFHCTRTPGCIKINDLERYKSCLPNEKKLLLDSFFVTHYQYLEDTRPIRHKALVILIPCNNCNKHKITPENCQFILDSKNRIFGFSFKITNKNSELYYMLKNNFLESMKVICFEWRINPFLYDNKEKFFQTYKISKQFDFNYSIPFNYRGSNPYRRSVPPLSNKKAYLSIFCTASKKEIQLCFKNKHEQITTIKYGWTMFCICSEYCLDLAQWTICTTQKPNEITLVSCHKPNFNMYILNNNRVPMSLFNLSLSNLYQNKLNSALNPTEGAVPKTLSQKAPPCYLFHLSSYDLSIESHDRCYCCGRYISLHISDW